MREKIDWKSYKASEFPPGMTAKDYCLICRYPQMADGSCRNCQEEQALEVKRVAEYTRMIGGKKAWAEHHEASFLVTQYNASALAVAKSFDPKVQNVLLWGPSGTGKSHLASIAKRRLILRGWRVLTVSMPDVIDEMVDNKRAFKSGSEQLEQLMTAPVLSIEDVSAGEKQTEDIVKLYFRVIDGRYKAGRKGLIVTTNYSPAELKTRWYRYDEPGRTVSRLQEMCRGKIFSLAGERDWRVE